LVCGIAGFIVPLVFIPAIVCGHVAQGRIRKSGNALGGGGQALAGVILGYCAAALWILVVGLAALGFAAGSLAINQAKTVASMSAATSLETAVNQFYSEYGSLPDVGGDTVMTDKGEGIRLLEILLGLEGGSGKVQNTHSIGFLAVKETRDRTKGGLLYGSGGPPSVEGLFDAWGNPFVVELDTTYEERLRFNMGGRRISLNGRRVAVHSAGADKKLGTDDDVKTW
jgi:hypothetical protein